MVYHCAIASLLVPINIMDVLWNEFVLSAWVCTYLQAGKLARIAIDEVHCASQWGNDFRPGAVLVQLQ